MWLYFSVPLVFIGGMALWVWWLLKPQRWLALAAGIFICVFAGGLFLLISTPEVGMLEAKRQAVIAQAQPGINALEAVLKNDPDDIKAWAQLGQAFMETGRFTGSAEAYRHAVLLSVGNPGMILQYNKALIFAADGEVSDDARNGMEMVLKLDKGNQEARYFLALRHFQDGDLQTAMHEMKTLYHELPADSPLKEIIDRQIGRK